MTIIDSYVRSIESIVRLNYNKNAKIYLCTGFNNVPYIEYVRTSLLCLHVACSEK